MVLPQLYRDEQYYVLSIRNQESDLAKINAIAEKVNDLSDNFANFKAVVPKMISDQINTAVTAVKKDVDSIVNPLITNVQQSLLDNYRAERNKVRSDIIISGIPQSMSTLDEMVKLVIQIGSVFEVNISSQEIYQCTWLRTKGVSRKMLVTFNSLIPRDKIMRKYFQQNMKLELNQLIPCEVSNRVFLNNNNPAKANKMYLYSRKLKKSGAIKHFRMNYATCSVDITACNNEDFKFSDLKDVIAKFPVPKEAL